MDLLKRINGLSAIINAANGEIVGKKKLQKLTYLAQEKGFYLGYDFIYHFHGVYSPALEADTRIGERLGVFSQEVTEEPGNPVKTTVVLDLDRPALSPDENATLGELRTLAKEEARVLEVLSTIVFLTKMEYVGAKRDELLHKQKGHLEKFFGEAYELFQEHFPELAQV